MFMNSLTVFQYNGSPITFSNGNNVMVNATEMAKPFGKETKDWLKNQSTKDFIEELSNVRNLLFADLVQVKQGSPENGGGTWMHEDVAMEFARWLSPAFAIWCNDRIKELLTTGTTSISQLSRKDLALMIIQAEEEKERLMLENKAQADKIAEDAPKVSFANAVMASNTSCLIGELAKILTQNGYEIGQNRLFQWLRENGYLGKHGERRNIPNQQYIEQGLFELKKGVRSGNDGVMKTTITPKITQKGCMYFVNKFINA